MAMTRGWLLTILVVAALAVGIPVLLVLGGFLDRGPQAMDDFQAEQEQLTKQAIDNIPKLASYGIRELSSDAKVGKADPEVFLSVMGMGDDGKLHDIQIRFLVARFGDTEKWECRTITIDDRMVFNAKNSPP